MLICIWSFRCLMVAITESIDFLDWIIDCIPKCRWGFKWILMMVIRLCLSIFWYFMDVLICMDMVSLHLWCLDFIDFVWMVLLILICIWSFRRLMGAITESIDLLLILERIIDCISICRWSFKWISMMIHLLAFYGCFNFLEYGFFAFIMPWFCFDGAINGILICIWSFRCLWWQLLFVLLNVLKKP